MFKKLFKLAVMKPFGIMWPAEFPDSQDIKLQYYKRKVDYIAELETLLC